MQNPVVATRSRLVKLRGGCQRATSWGAAGEAQVPGPRFLPRKQILRELFGTVLFPNKDAGRGLWLHTGWGARKSRLGPVEGTSLQAVVGSEARWPLACLVALPD